MLVLAWLLMSGSAVIGAASVCSFSEGYISLQFDIDYGWVPDRGYISDHCSFHSVLETIKYTPTNPGDQEFPICFPVQVLLFPMSRLI